MTECSFYLPDFHAEICPLPLPLQGSGCQHARLSLCRAPEPWCRDWSSTASFQPCLRLANEASKLPEWMALSSSCSELKLLIEPWFLLRTVLFECCFLRDSKARFTSILLFLALVLKSFSRVLNLALFRLGVVFLKFSLSSTKFTKI